MSPEELELDANPAAPDDSADSMAEFALGGDYDVLDDDEVDEDEDEDEEQDEDDVERGSDRAPVERDADDDSPRSLDELDDDEEDDEDLDDYFGGDKDNY